MFKSALERLEEAALMPPQRKTSEREKKKKATRLFVKGIKMGLRGCKCWDRNRRQWEREPSERGLSKKRAADTKATGWEREMCWDAVSRSWVWAGTGQQQHPRSPSSLL